MRVRIQLAEGFKFVKYPVATVQYSDREVVGLNELLLVFSGVTSKPVAQTYYPTYNSGYLEYQFQAGTVRAEIGGFQFSPDETVIYKNMTLTGAIQVTSRINGVETNQATMDINVLEASFYPYNYFWIHEGTQPQLSSSQFKTTYIALCPNDIFYKNFSFFYSYPPQFTYVAAHTTPTTVDTGAGVVSFSYTNIRAASFSRDHFLTLKAEGVATGTYTATPSRYEAELFDGTVVTGNVHAFSVKIIDPSTAIDANRMGLVARNVFYNPMVDENMFIQ